MVMPSKAVFGRCRLSEFGLNSDLIHANHGSFGAVPDALCDAQQLIRDEVRQSPSGFLRGVYPGRIRDVAGQVAGFLGGNPDDWVFVENATVAANVIISSIPLAAGDEILTTDQIYGAVRKVIDQRCRATGARRVEAAIVLPVSGPGELFDAVVAASTDRTKLVVLDHVSSPCGLLFPVAELCAHFRDKGVPVFVDGAHAPGNIDVDVAAVGADFYTGNAHKWLCAPLGAAMLWCRPECQQTLRPLVISHGYGLGFAQAFDWPGTRDFSAWLTIPAAIALHQTEGGSALRTRNHAVAYGAAQQLAAEFDTLMVAPCDMQTSMATVRLPLAHELSLEQIDALHISLERDHNTVVALNNAGGSTWLRLSAAIYSETEELVIAGRRTFQAILNLQT